MNPRIVWPLVAALGLAGLFLLLSPSSAQRSREGERPGPGGPPGAGGATAARFVVAHASATQVLILDTMTGQVYRAKQEDFKKMSELTTAARGDIGQRAEPRERDGRRIIRPRDRRPPAKEGDEKEKVKEKEPLRRPQQERE